MTARTRTNARDHLQCGELERLPQFPFLNCHFQFLMSRLSTILSRFIHTAREFFPLFFKVCFQVAHFTAIIPSTLYRVEIVLPVHKSELRKTKRGTAILFTLSNQCYTDKISEKKYMSGCSRLFENNAFIVHCFHDEFYNILEGVGLS